ncbi:MAG TPA: alpha/beta fold hydrolase [Actinomycetes bacterium]
MSERAQTGREAAPQPVRARVNFVRRGAGEPLVLIHGIGHRWQAWLPIMEELAAHHEVIALDLPGFGASPVPPGGMPSDMAQTVAGLVTFLAGEGLDQPHVAGNSLGGAIALELAVAGVARSATAFSPAGFFTAREVRRAMLILKTMRASSFLPATVARATLRFPTIRAICFGPLVAYPRRIDPLMAAQDAAAFRAGRGFTAVARASHRYRFHGATAVPVTVAWGDRDRILRPHQARRARELLPQAHHVILPGCGHVPMNDNPALVASLIMQTTGAIPVRS